MKYLMDTHTALWALGDKSKLSPRTQGIIDDTSAGLCISIASVWEIAIKVSLGKLLFHGGAAVFLQKMQANHVEILGIERAYIIQLESLPYIHRDPFDRVLIATAQVSGLTLLTADTNIQKYDVLWAW